MLVTYFLGPQFPLWLEEREGLGWVTSVVWLCNEATSPAPLPLGPLNVDCRPSEPSEMTQPKLPFRRQEN